MKTPNSERIHIGIFGRRNSGKSTIINSITRQEIALVSPVAGTTTDPVYQPMEVEGLGACTFIDTAGFDDQGELGEMRIAQTQKALDKVDIAVLVFTEEDFSHEINWIKTFENGEIPYIPVVNKIDIIADSQTLGEKISALTGKNPVLISGKDSLGIGELLQRLREVAPNCQSQTITGNLCKGGDLVLLVMPQDENAPKGRLILPQVQTIRELLDKGSIVQSCTMESFGEGLKKLSSPPDLIITDSSVFPQVEKLTPKGSKLTSFSVLFAGYKGDIVEYVKGAKALSNLAPNSRILIAECCTHAPKGEDIGTVKLPKLLRKKLGHEIQISHVNGNDFPRELGQFDLVILCGGCMFNRQHIISRIRQAKNQSTPITNYGIAIAYLTGILDKITLPQ